MYMRASGASELWKFSHFYIKKLSFLSIFCWYLRYFVGTNDMLVGLIYTCTDKFPNAPTKLGKSKLWWGGDCPPPPSGYANYFQPATATRPGTVYSRGTRSRDLIKILCTVYCFLSFFLFLAVSSLHARGSVLVRLTKISFMPKG